MVNSISYGDNPGYSLRDAALQSINLLPLCFLLREIIHCYASMLMIAESCPAVRPSAHVSIYICTHTPIFVKALFQQHRDSASSAMKGQRHSHLLMKYVVTHIFMQTINCHVTMRMILSHFNTRGVASTVTS